MFVSGLALLPLLAAPCIPDRAEELRAAVTALSSVTAADRSRGERWLAAHAASADYPTLADTAVSGGAEVRVRLARAVGGLLTGTTVR